MIMIVITVMVTITIMIIIVTIITIFNKGTQIARCKLCINASNILSVLKK